MTLQAKNWQNIYYFLTNRIVYHSLFWLTALVLLSALEFFQTGEEVMFTVGNNVIRVLILSAAVYYNIYFLIPRYLAQKKFSTYFGWLALLVFIVSPIEAFLLYFKTENVPQLQANIVGNLNWSFVPNFFFLGVSTAAKITLDWYKNLREKQELQTQTMQSELRFLKSQINPHFLFNTLNSLYALTLKKSDEAPEIVLKLSEMMRYMLYECNERWVPLSKEVAYIGNYLDLERLRQGKNVDIRFGIEGNVSDQKIAPLMFIPFIENCFKHGLGHQISKGFVRIVLKVDDNQIRFFVENSKPDNIPLQIRHARSGGIGLANVRRRLDLLYPDRYKLDIEDGPKTYAVHLKMLLD
jgi:hypothetical protein